MNDWRVSWVVDTPAENPAEAAERALAMQRDEESTATSFVVTNHATGERHHVELGTGDGVAIVEDIDARTFARLSLRDAYDMLTREGGPTEAILSTFAALQTLTMERSAATAPSGKARLPIVAFSTRRETEAMAAAAEAAGWSECCVVPEREGERVKYVLYGVPPWAPHLASAQGPG